MRDRFNRTINYLRISVTDRCNLRCRYCMPEEGVPLQHQQDTLSLEEIVEVVKVAASEGVSRIRLTGGEPLVRKGIVQLVKWLNDVPGIEEVSMTTNGILLSNMASELASAGLARVNVSLDSVNPDKYHEMTRGGDINAVFRGIEAAKLAGLTPIKLNCVVMNSSDEAEALSVKAFAKANDLKVQFIHQMDLETGQFSRVEGGEGGNCRSCSRLRLMANGCIKPCLFHESGFNVREHGILPALQMAVDQKPAAGSKNKSGKFYNIGG